MICPDCGSDNPAGNRFCGMCGGALVGAPPLPASDGGRPEPERGEPVSHIAGPSILGLGESDEGTGSYLLEDEPRRSRAGLLFLLLVVVAVGAVFAYQRHYIELPHWAVRMLDKLNIHKPAAPPVVPSSSASPAAPAANPATSDIQQEPPAPMTQSDRPTDTSTPTPAQPETPVSSKQQELPAVAKSQTPAVPTRPSAVGKMTAPAQPQTKASAEDAEDNSDPDTDAEAPPPAPKKPSAAHLRAAKEAERKKQADDRLLMLGENYLYGRGVARNCDQALIYMKAAASSRNAKAMGHLGAMYATGNCAPLDRPAAYRWFTLARQADPANPWLESNRQMVWRQMTAAEQDRAARQ